MTAPGRVHGTPAFVSAGLATSGLCSLLLLTGSHSDSPIGVPSYWPWLLTGLQVLALWSAGRGRAWGWLLGGSVQIPWIIYSVLTSQLGFIPGCAVSAAIQIHTFRGKTSLSSGDRAEIGLYRVGMPGEIMT